MNYRVEAFFFFNDTATTEIYTLSLHDALPIWRLFKRRNNTGFSRIPSRLAHRARPIRQSWYGATLSRLLPPSPPTRGSGCLQLHPAATTTGQWTVSHLHPDTQRLVAHNTHSHHFAGPSPSRGAKTRQVVSSACRCHEPRDRAAMASSSGASSAQPARRPRPASPARHPRPAWPAPSPASSCSAPPRT